MATVHSSLSRVRLVLLPLSLGVLAACRLSQNVAGPQPESSLKLIVGHQETATFIPINNNLKTVSIPEEGDDHSPEAKYWNGLLIQLGAYDKNPTPPQAYFGNVVFEKGDKIIETLSPPQFSWINIVAAHKGSGPLKAEQEYHLRPNKKVSGNDCEPLEKCVGKACICTDPQDPDCKVRATLEGQCIRDKNLHRYFDTKAIVTYWQGENGYQVSALAPALVPDGSKPVDSGSDHYAFNRYEFVFHDAAVIEVYSEDERPRTKKYKSGVDVDTIKINWLPPTPNHGMHQDPPWRLP